MKISNEPDYQLDIIKEMSIKNNIPVNILRKIVYSPYKFVKEIMVEGECNKVMINGFIHFSVNPIKKKKYLEYRENQLNKKDDTKSKEETSRD